MNSKDQHLSPVNGNTDPKPLVIYGGPLYDGNGRIYADGAVYIQNGRVTAAGTEENVFEQIPKTVDLEVYDTLGCIIIPGLINLRNHFYRSMALGLKDLFSGKTALDPQQYFWHKYDQCLDDEIVQLAVLSSILDAIKSGVTCIFDLHSSPLAISNILDNIASVVARSGIKAVLGVAISECYGEDIFIRSMEENKRFIENNSASNIEGTFGIQPSPQTTDNALEMIRKTAPENVGFQIECAAPGQLQDLKNHRLINSKSTVTFLSPPNQQDLDILQSTGACNVYAPNRHNQHVSGEILTGIGTSGFGASILQALRFEFENEKMRSGRSNPFSSIHTLYSGNTAFAGRYFPGKPGVLEKTAAADIAIFDYSPVTPITNENYLQHLLFGMQQTPAKAVMVGGTFIYNNHTFLTLDDEIIMAESRKASRHLLERYAKL